MSFTNNQSQMGQSPFQNLDTVSALTEISDEVATICSGGSDVELYSEPGFKGNRLGVNGTLQDLANFDDETESVIVNKGTWTLYPGKNLKDPAFGSKKIVIGPGRYDAKALQARGLDNKSLSSLAKA
jgi:hypothetical protein